MVPTYRFVQRLLTSYSQTTFSSISTDPTWSSAKSREYLKPGGRFLVKTPNAWHYVTVLARLTPHRFHQWINWRRGRRGADTFPTRYRANTRTALGVLAANAGLDVASVVSVESRPEYTRISPVLYVFGRLYERIVNSTDWGALFRVVLLGEFAKPGRASR